MHVNRTRWLLAGVAALCAAANVVAEDAVIRRLGTIDEYIVETSPIVHKGRLWLFEYIRYTNENKKYAGNSLGVSYFRFRDLETLQDFTPPFAKGLHLGSAFVEGDRVVVTGVSKWGGDRFFLTESSDLVNWTEPRVILSGEGWSGYNTSVCKAGDRYVMVYELGKPKELVGHPFTMFFAESRDLRDWKTIPGAVFGKDFYTGAPLLRHFDGMFYFFYLDHQNGAYRTRVARSRDLKAWAVSPKIVMAHEDAADRAIHPQARLTDAQRKSIAAAENRNVSDLDFCFHGGRLVCAYSWGNQLGTEFLALGEVKGMTEQEFCESFFEKTEK
ncbi:MAG: hypothetical protein IJR99_15735 [Kiritimatiellae bacterium]|nr:hypothetical protein [Kiritimatiellia bacterium]